MVRIYKGKTHLRVTYSAFEDMFKPLGFKVESDNKENKSEMFGEKHTETEEVEEETSEVPIMEMNKEQLMDFAKKNNIDTSKAKNVSEARRIIQNTIRKRNM